jgi:hypothetical protein
MSSPGEVSILKEWQENVYCTEAVSGEISAGFGGVRVTFGRANLVETQR